MKACFHRYNRFEILSYEWVSVNSILLFMKNDSNLMQLNFISGSQMENISTKQLLLDRNESIFYNFKNMKSCLRFL
jgi:hypothetical protein